MDLPASSVHNLCHVQNCAAHLILNKRKTDHITLLFQSLHWRPIPQRIQYMINALCYECITGTAPFNPCDYMSSTLHPLPNNPLCFRYSRLQIRRTRLCTFGSCTFSDFGPSTRKYFPLLLRQKPSLEFFNSNLRTFLSPKQ